MRRELVKVITLLFNLEKGSGNPVPQFFEGGQLLKRQVTFKSHRQKRATERLDHLVFQMIRRNLKRGGQ